MSLLTRQNAKTSKGEKKGYITGILYLKPAESGGYKNVCPQASEGCKAACLNTAGRGIFNQVQNGRQRKTDLLFNNPEFFFGELARDIDRLVNYAKKKGMTPAVRINGTSDMPSIARRMAKLFPNVQFYDYTKLAKPYTRVLPNYHITFSRSETNLKECLDALENGVNVAVVFRKDLPKTWLGYRVINGDETDLRFLDGKAKNGKGLVIGLKAKGKAKKDTSGFVVKPGEVKRVWK